jgi:hypothetical protein
MVAILLAALGIPTGGLKMAVRKWANPDISPRWRNCQRFDPLKNVRFRQLGPIGARISKALSGLSASDSRPTVRNVTQASRFSGILRVNDGLHGTG